ncbi:hypothetical protein NPIL_613551 [Nephila pilipes]|uniref:Uncharacterized protein n=1 Tax=Nephila pilipes TaxID=299642 RepID=A0A8X6UMQ8_NEPPI|nr:hypothetical protein NPIL_613551 [Nephila pilipes]
MEISNTFWCIQFEIINRPKSNTTPQSTDSTPNSKDSAKSTRNKTHPFRVNYCCTLIWIRISIRVRNTLRREAQYVSGPAPGAKYYWRVQQPRRSGVFGERI